MCPDASWGKALETLGLVTESETFSRVRGFAEIFDAPGIPVAISRDSTGRQSQLRPAAVKDHSGDSGSAGTGCRLPS